MNDTLAYLHKDKKDDDDSILDLGMDSSEHYKTYTTSETFDTHHIYLSDSIANAHGYASLAHKLRSMKDRSLVKMYLACYGGDVAGGLQLINAIKDSPAQVIMVVDTPCYSMASLLALSGDALIMNPDTFLMFHNYGAIVGGKGGALLEQLHNEDRWLTRSNDRICSPFLTKKELASLVKDQDLYIHWDDPSLALRLHRHFPRVYPKPLKVGKAHKNFEIEIEVDK